MRHAKKPRFESLRRLFRFLVWYGLAVGVLLQVLPMGARLLEGSYDALSGTVKFFSVIGVVAVLGAWQVVTQCERWRTPGGGEDG